MTFASHRLSAAAGRKAQPGQVTVCRGAAQAARARVPGAGPGAGSPAGRGPGPGPAVGSESVADHRISLRVFRPAFCGARPGRARRLRRLARAGLRRHGGAD